MARDPAKPGSLDDRTSGLASWQKILRATFADVRHKAELLPLAEQALRACPDDGHVMLLAATAALIDRRPARAPAAQGPCRSCGKPLCRACFPAACARCGAAGEVTAVQSAPSGH
jgi:hypothetical protein